MGLIWTGRHGRLHQKPAVGAAAFRRADAVLLGDDLAGGMEGGVAAGDETFLLGKNPAWADQRKQTVKLLWKRTAERVYYTKNGAC